MSIPGFKKKTNRKYFIQNVITVYLFYVPQWPDLGTWAST